MMALINHELIRVVYGGCSPDEIQESHEEVEIWLQEWIGEASGEEIVKKELCRYLPEGWFGCAIKGE